MDTVYLVQHVRFGGSAGDVKVIGIYSSERNAEIAVETLREQPGFRDHPRGFSIEEYTLDEDHWSEGFTTLVNLYVRIEGDPDNEYGVVEAERLGPEHYRISVLPEDDEIRWQFETGQVVRCESRALPGGFEGLVAIEAVEPEE